MLEIMIMLRTLMKMIINKTKMDDTLSMIMMTLVYWANVRGQDAEATISDVYIIQIVIILQPTHHSL